MGEILEDASNDDGAQNHRQEGRTSSHHHFLVHDLAWAFVEGFTDFPLRCWLVNA